MPRPVHNRARTPGARTRLLALDTSSTCVGWALFDDGVLTDYGKFIQVGEGHGERLYRFGEWLDGMFIAFEPDEVVIEEPFAGLKTRTYGILLLYVGVVVAKHFQHKELEMPDEHRIKAHLVKRLNEFVKGSHETNKKNAVLKANQFYGLGLKFKANDRTKRHTEDDIADAILLGRAHYLRTDPTLAEGPSTFKPKKPAKAASHGRARKPR